MLEGHNRAQVHQRKVEYITKKFNVHKHELISNNSLLIVQKL